MHEEEIDITILAFKSQAFQALVYRYLNMLGLMKGLGKFRCDEDLASWDLRFHNGSSHRLLGSVGIGGVEMAIPGFESGEDGGLFGLEGSESDERHLDARGEGNGAAE